MIKNLNFEDNKRVIIQEYNKTQISFESDSIQVCAREWDPQNWKISEPFELLVSKRSQFTEIHKVLQEIFPHIKVNVILKVL